MFYDITPQTLMIKLSHVEYGELLVHSMEPTALSGKGSSIRYASLDRPDLFFRPSAIRLDCLQDQRSS